jgi:hypothetical protein
MRMVDARLTKPHQPEAAMRIHVDPVTVLAWGGFFGAMIAWSLIAPNQMSAVAEEPVKMAAATIDKLFPDVVDPKLFRHYDITLDDSISTDVLKTQVVKKIGHGRVSSVTIVTTPSGTYSTDGIRSPHVQYPGIEKHRKSWGPRSWYYSYYASSGGGWTSYSSGSFTYYIYRSVAART